MNTRLRAWTWVVALICSGSCPATASSVSEMFAAIRSGNYTERYDKSTFPKLSWTDISELITYVKSTNVVTSIPVNGISSERTYQCVDGMIALWLIEGIRVGRGFPSLNPVCYDKSISVPPRSLFYGVAQQKSVARAYITWWQKVRGMTRDKSSRHDPLTGTALSWFGGRIPKEAEKRGAPASIVVEELKAKSTK
jgi:hypothetical protein